MPWLYLHFPRLLADHYSRQVDDAPVALTHGTPPVICEVSKTATEAGIQLGQSLATAQGLCPQLNLHPFCEATQKRLLRELATTLYTLLSPLTLWEPDGLLTRPDRLMQLYGSLAHLTEQLHNALAPKAFQYHLATGTTPRMARLLARESGVCCEDDAVLMEAARALPVTATDWPVSVQKRLRQMGLRTLSDLLNCCASELTSRLGPELREDLQRIMGTRAEPLSEFHPPDRFHHWVELAQETRQVSVLRPALAHLLRALERFLREHQFGCTRLHVTLYHPDHPETPFTIRTSRQEYHADAFMDLALLHLNALHLVDDVRAIAIEAFNPVTRTRHETDLFGGGQPRSHAQNDLFCRLQARLGPNRIHQAALYPDPRPEKALCWQARQLQKGPVREHPARPIWLQEPPLPLKEQPQHWINGPERIQGGWWDGHYVRRDYYIAVLANGRRVWLYRTEQNQWFIHGWFG